MGFFVQSLLTSGWLLDVSQCEQQLGFTLFHKPHFAWGAFLPQAKAVAALGTADGGVLWGDTTFTPRHPVHLPLLLLVREGTLPLLALRRWRGKQDAVHQSVNERRRISLHLTVQLVEILLVILVLRPSVQEELTAEN